MRSSRWSPGSEACPAASAPTSSGCRRSNRPQLLPQWPPPNRPRPALGAALAASNPLTLAAAGTPRCIAIAQRYLGIPYVWGGASPSTGFDCSGLVLYVYAQIGIQLSHGATDQQRASRPVPLNALAPGDLVFYGNASYSYHVAIYVGGGRTIEAARTGTPVRYGIVGSAWIGGRF